MSSRNGGARRTGTSVERDARSAAALAGLFGGRTVSDSEIRALLGVSDRTAVRVRSDGTTVSLSAERPIESMATIRPRADGTLELHLEWVGIPEGMRGQGVGVKGVARQLRAATAAGRFSEATGRFLRRSGNAQDRANGYYTFARMGFNASLSAQQRANAARGGFAGVQTVRDLMQTEGGRTWWRQHGDTTEMTFDLRTGSQSWADLNAYLSSKGF